MRNVQGPVTTHPRDILMCWGANVNDEELIKRLFNSGKDFSAVAKLSRFSRRRRTSVALKVTGNTHRRGPTYLNVVAII